MGTFPQNDTCIQITSSSKVSKKKLFHLRGICWIQKPYKIAQKLGSITNHQVQCTDSGKTCKINMVNEAENSKMYTITINQFLDNFFAFSEISDKVFSQHICTRIKHIILQDDLSTTYRITHIYSMPYFSSFPVFTSWSLFRKRISFHFEITY